MKRLLIAIMMICGLQTSVNASIVSVRNHEITRLSMCPQLTSLMILDGPLTEESSRYLRDYPGFYQKFQLIERSQFGEDHPACQTKPSAQRVFTDDNFAMYLLAFAYDPKSAAPQPLHMQVMRTDTGKILYEVHTSIGGEFATIADFLEKKTPEWLEIISKQRNECLNQFTATVTEDVKLRCQGQLSTSTEYDINSDFRLIFTIRSFDLAKRNLAQSLGGSMMIVPQPAKTKLNLLIQQKTPTCLFSVASEKTLNINLAEKTLPAIFNLTIPEDLSKHWQFEPNVTSADAFFTGDQLEENSLTSKGDSKCPEKNNFKREVTQSTFSDFNNFRFSAQEFSPFCDASNFVQPVFSRAPNLGTPVEQNITAGCTRSSLNAQVAFKRRFYLYR